ncbi:hypothetical protein VP1G_01110 [Cytospora mali]|uniref:Efficient mitochondria targeting-associated protein 19 n=1 Tax=Cytospora mali TaxID=578113 RepID=A0A194UQ74_CYTMA|nr:hypothetical protein VP1G_01110 [Valsa mali var. pyri (nom. inval.)]
MATSPKNWRDKLWLVWLILQIVCILFIDAVQFYPEWLYKAPGSPLYCLQQLKDFYVATYNDPLVQPETEPNWIRLMFIIELCFQLPVVFYATWRLSGKRGTTGRLELLLLVYAFETAFSTLLCINDVFSWDPMVYSPEQKNVFLCQLYGPWFAIPSLMFIDMYVRLHNRLASTDVVKKTQ